MIQILQAFRIGVVNLFGITVPGFLLLFFAVFGILVPLLNVVLHISRANWTGVIDFYQKNTFVIIAITLIVSYVAGFILRLSSPDELDQVSGQLVIRTFKNNEKEKALWPYTGEEGDKFPYYNFRKYLEARSLNNLLPFVTWGPDKNTTETGINYPTETKRSKTTVNVMKLDIMNKSPDLSAVVESNEAHIRLMSGTWLAIRATTRLVDIGLILTAMVAILFYATWNLPFADKLLPRTPNSHSPYYLVSFVLLVAIRIAMRWARKRIEGLFHYRRVSELLFIVQAAHMVSEQMETVSNDRRTPEKAEEKAIDLLSGVMGKESAAHKELR